MILLLDTNVVSEIINLQPDAKVLHWVDRQFKADLFVSVVTIFEMRYGIEIKPPGRRKDILEKDFEGLIRQDFAGRVLELDVEAVRASAALQAQRKKAGKPIQIADCLIAGTAISRKASMVTRDVNDFGALPISVINPWTA